MAKVLSIRETHPVCPVCDGETGCMGVCNSCGRDAVRASDLASLLTIFGSREAQVSVFRVAMNQAIKRGDEKAANDYWYRMTRAMSEADQCRSTILEKFA